MMQRDVDPRGSTEVPVVALTVLQAIAV